jgi:GTP-binding protein Era
MIFLDTPGLLRPADLLQRSMLSAAREAVAEADVLLLVLDATRPSSPEEKASFREALSGAPDHISRIAAVNKIDSAKKGTVERISRWAGESLGAEPFPVSALTGKGTEALLRRLEETLPPGPHLFPDDEIARDPVRFFVAEIVRESVFETFYEEVPYSTFCRVEEFREDQDPLYIQAHLFVETKSQKKIVVGKGGSSIRALGSMSRRKIEEFLERRVYLDLWVKVLPNWRRKRSHLKRLGFPVPESREGASS